MSTQSTTSEYVDSNGTAIRVVRSARRKKTISGAWKQNTMVVSVPVGLGEQAERLLVADMVKKVMRKVVAGHSIDPDAQLLKRARAMDAELFGSQASPAGVRWVSNQNSRWGSASLHTRQIRLSDKLRPLPQWVQDYVLAHELAHLVEPRDGHGARFKAVLARYPRVHDATIFLSGVSHGYRAAERATPNTQPEIPAPSGDTDFDDFDDEDFDDGDLGSIGSRVLA
ncbi:MAG: M48 family metallopeptidase [Paeniglutamicibacter terrestris]|uniref:M48 family metallopeptidase n=1 Tax=Paeniglutamicibacter terrestris TaxID=2723403 RepID=A0ABX1G325_9MICC|nr:M48 family metallopeptidase [Paeniglutamicibacter terrestris]ASN39801.1 metal-dependent hydrolase [Arthrobacter sp. 7749]NKG20434.1 M48 family metallopeptidase [Paeniglutamicibacter terrestris]